VALESDGFHFTVIGPNNSPVKIMESDDLVTWITVANVTLTGGTYPFVDTTAGTTTHRFYCVKNESGSSVNTIGFISVVVPAKNPDNTLAYMMLANQLNNPAGNTLDILFPTLPKQSQVGLWHPGASWYTYSKGGIPPVWSSTPALDPGMGAFVHAGGTTPIPVTFVGDVPQGRQINSFSADVGQYVLLSSIIPRAGTLDDLGFPAMEGDQLLQWIGQQWVMTATYTGGHWSATPTIQIGESFFLQSATSGTRTWTENFSGCQPSLGSESMSGGNFQFIIYGSPGVSVQVKASDDLATWTSLGTVTLTGGSYNFVDTTAGSSLHRFYCVQENGVSSVNTIGFITVTVPAKNPDGTLAFTMLANQLNNPAGNTLDVLFPSLPKRSQAELWDPNLGWTMYLKGGDPAYWFSTPAINPGMGAAVHAGGTVPVTVTFVGDVPQGQQISTFTTAASGIGQYVLLSSIVPRAGTLDDLGFPAMEGDQLLQWIGQQWVMTATYTGGHWSATPTIQIGESFFLQSATSGTRTWTENLQGCP
jgi:hypothetical protein